MKLILKVKYEINNTLWLNEHNRKWTVKWTQGNLWVGNSSMQQQQQKVELDTESRNTKGVKKLLVNLDPRHADVFT